jgi:hypothetical protein
MGLDTYIFVAIRFPQTHHATIINDGAQGNGEERMGCAHHRADASRLVG